MDSFFVIFNIKFAKSMSNYLHYHYFYYIIIVMEDMSMVVGNTLSKIIDIVDKFLAFVVLAAYAIFAINSNWEFITNEVILQIINYIMYYGPIGICCLVLLEFGVKRNSIIQIILFAIMAVVIVFQFFPDTFDAIVSRFK